MGIYELRHMEKRAVAIAKDFNDALTKARTHLPYPDNQRAWTVHKLAECRSSMSSRIVCHNCCSQDENK